MRSSMGGCVLKRFMKALPENGATMNMCAVACVAAIANRLGGARKQRDGVLEILLRTKREERAARVKVELK